MARSKHVAAGTSVPHVVAAPQAAPMAQPVPGTSSRALPLWVPGAILVVFVAMTVGTLSYRRSHGESLNLPSL